MYWNISANGITFSNLKLRNVCLSVVSHPRKNKTNVWTKLKALALTASCVNHLAGLSRTSWAPLEPGRPVDRVYCIWLSLYLWRWHHGKQNRPRHFGADRSSVVVVVLRSWIGGLEQQPTTGLIQGRIYLKAEWEQFLSLSWHAKSVTSHVEYFSWIINTFRAVVEYISCF